MTILRYIILLTTTYAVGQAVHLSESPTRETRQPKAAVQRLYGEVVARHPIGIPEDADLKVFAPYLSKALKDRIDLARACAIDYSHQHQRPDQKPGFEWSETGLFSGGNEKASPRAFHIEGVQPEKDGFFRVLVSLSWGMPESPLTWHVGAIVRPEDGHFVVDDVVYLKDETRPVESRLSEALTLGCDGPRWVGFGNKQSDQKK